MDPMDIISMHQRSDHNN